MDNNALELRRIVKYNLHVALRTRELDERPIRKSNLGPRFLRKIINGGVSLMGYHYPIESSTYLPLRSGGFSNKWVDVLNIGLALSIPTLASVNDLEGHSVYVRPVHDDSGFAYSILVATDTSYPPKKSPEGYRGLYEFVTYERSIFYSSILGLV